MAQPLKQERMDRYAVIGQPIAHSLSPRIHADFAHQARIALEYEAIEVSEAALEQELSKLHRAGYKGLNVTLPHKVSVAAFCENRSERAKLAGAVNTLVRSDTGWNGDNTDGEGLIRDLRDNFDIEVRGRRILLLGAGGAARGVIGPLLAQNPAELVLSNRNPWKPEALAEHFKPVGVVRPCTHLALKGDRFDLIINATSAGHSGEMPRLPGQLLAEGGACYDLSYGSAHAPFHAWAESQNASLIADGIGMLAEQAAVAFELWNGVLPRTDALIAVLRKAL